MTDTVVVQATSEKASSIAESPKKLGNLRMVWRHTSAYPKQIMFALLALKPARLILGFGGNWEMSDAAAVALSLLALRDSSIGLKQQTYFALHDMVLGSFYSDPKTWLSTGYPGPPKLA